MLKNPSFDGFFRNFFGKSQSKQTKEPVLEVFFMKKWMQALALALALALLFAGCKKDEAPQEPQTPDTPPVEQPQTPAAPEVPAQPATPPDPFGGLTPEDQQYIEEHALWMELMNPEFLIPEEDRDLLDAQLMSTDQNNTEYYLVWNIKTESDGSRLPSRLRVTAVLDGKDQKFQVEDDPTFDQVCQTIQLHRFEANGQSDVGIPYLVDEVALQTDGSYLVKLHGHYAPGNRWDCIGRAVLETLPDGSYVVASWADEAGSSYGADQLTINEDGTYTVTPAA